MIDFIAQGNGKETWQLIAFAAGACLLLVTFVALFFIRRFRNQNIHTNAAINSMQQGICLFDSSERLDRKSVV